MTCSMGNPHCTFFRRGLLDDTVEVECDGGTVHGPDRIS